MEKEVSGEEFRRMSAERNIQPASFVAAHRVVLAAALTLVVVAGLSFAGGIQYQKGKRSPSIQTTAAANQFSDGRQNFRSFGGPAGQRPAVGTVKAVSSTSITVTSERTGTDSTLAITSATVVTNADASAVVADIKVSDTVLVQADSSDPATAARIIINPPMMRGQSGGTDGSGPTTQIQLN